MLIGYGGHAGLEYAGDSLIHINRSNNVLLACIGHAKKNGDAREDAYTLSETLLSGEVNSIEHTMLVALYKRGVFSEAAFNSGSAFLPAVYFLLIL